MTTNDNTKESKQEYAGISTCRVGQCIKLGDETWERVMSTDEWDDPKNYMRVQWADHQACSTFRRVK